MSDKHASMITETPKAIIWDMDGVIADTAPFHFQAWHDLVTSKGRAYTEEDFHYGFGLRNNDILTYLFGNLKTAEMEALSREKEAIFRAKIKGCINPFPGVIALVEILREMGFAMALASSAPIENIELILSSIGITKYFDSIISAEDVTKGKPDPQAFLMAAEQLGAAPERCIVIEDAIAGIEAAKAAGMKCIAVTNTHSPEALAKADLVTDNLERINSENIRFVLS